MCNFDFLELNGMNPTYDLIIIGAGPIGITCGLEAKKAGLNYLILEKGCLVNSLYNYPLNMTFFSTSEKLEIGGVPFVSNNAKPMRPEALEYYRRIASSASLNIQLQETVKSITPSGNRYGIETSISNYLTTHVVIAIGFYDIPVMMNVPGENLSKVFHYYRDPHFFAMQKVAVVGASNSAVDAALETYRKGANVTMIVRGEEIGRRVKYWVRPDIDNRIKEGSIKAYFQSKLLAIREKEIDLLTPAGAITLENDYVIAMTGYQPNLEFLKRTGIILSDDEKKSPVYNPETMESNLDNIYLAGVVCGGMETHVWFIENSREHANKIIASIVSK